MGLAILATALVATMATNSLPAKVVVWLVVFAAWRLLV